MQSGVAEDVGSAEAEAKSSSRAERKAAARIADSASEADLPQEKHLRRQQERREAKSRQPEKKGGLGRVVNTQRFTGIQGFYHATVSEIRKVEWPDREATRNLTILVISLSVVLGLLLGGLDYVLFQLFEAMA